MSAVSNKPSSAMTGATGSDHSSNALDNSVPELNLFKDLDKSLDSSSGISLIDGSSPNMSSIPTSPNPFGNDFFGSQDGLSDSFSFAVSPTTPVDNRVHVETTVPSIKHVVSKYGGIVDWKAHRAKTVERRKRVHNDLEKAVQELPKYKERSKSVEAEKIKVLQELDHTKKAMEELKHSLEKAVTEEVQAKQDCELLVLRTKEMEQGVTSSASVAAKTQLEVAKQRHKTAVEDLIAVRQEAEDTKRKYAALVNEKDIAIKQANKSISVSKDMDKKVEDLTLQLITIKSLLESAQSAHLEAEDRRINLQGDSMKWESELKKAEAEIRQIKAQQLMIDDLKSKYQTTSATLAALKTQLNSHLEGIKMGKDVATMQANRSVVLDASLKELHEVRNKIEKSRDEVNSLKTTVSALSSEIELEKNIVATLRQGEGMESTLASSLEAELSQVKNEIEQMVRREKEAREKAIELSKLLQQATEEAERAKSVANSAQEDLRRVKNKAEEAKAAVTTMKTRPLATLKEIEATKESSRVTISAVKALEESQQSCKLPNCPVGVKLTVAEYEQLNKNAQRAEEIANKRVLSAIDQIKCAKESESVCQKQLEDAKKTLEEAKKDLKAVLVITEKAKEGKLEMENELNRRKSNGEAPNDHLQIVSSSPRTDNHLQIIASHEGRSSGPNHKMKLPQLCTIGGSSSLTKAGSSTTNTGSPRTPRMSKRSMFPRFVLFLARKKAQTLK